MSKGSSDRQGCAHHLVFSNNMVDESKLFSPCRINRRPEHHHFLSPIWAEEHSPDSKTSISGDKADVDVWITPFGTLRRHDDITQQPKRCS